MPRRTRREIDPKDFINIAEAAKLLGVSLPTMRRWDETGKFPARRHPVNRYRLYLREKVMKLRQKIIGETKAA